MRAYIIRRLLLTIPTVFMVSLIIFFMIRLIPGSIVDIMAIEAEYYGGTEIDTTYIEQALGLDVPVHVQYWRWVTALMHGDLGDSLWTRLPVSGEIIGRFPLSAELAILAMLIMLIISLPIGIYSALRQDTMGDYLTRSFATGLIALPNFWVGLIVILFASLWFGISPPLRYVSFTENPIRNLGQFIVPAFILGMAGTGTVMRMTRSMMLEVLRQDYIRTAWAKGLKERTVIMRHALKNALIPVVTMLGMTFPTLVGGAVIIEVVFGLPGIGRLLVDAVTSRDYTVVSGIIFFYAILLVLINLAVDLTYGYLDPRIQYK